MTSTERRQTRLSQEADDALLFLRPRLAEPVSSDHKLGAWLQPSGASPTTAVTSPTKQCIDNFWSRPPEFDCRSPIGISRAQPNWEPYHHSSEQNVMRSPQKSLASNLGEQLPHFYNQKTTQLPNRARPESSPTRKRSPRITEFEIGEAKRKFLYQQSTKAEHTSRRSSAPSCSNGESPNKFNTRRTNESNKHNDAAYRKGCQSTRNSRRRPAAVITSDSDSGTPMSTLGFGMHADDTTPSSLSESPEQSEPVTNRGNTTRIVPSGLGDFYDTSKATQPSEGGRSSFCHSNVLKPSKTIQFKLGLDMIPWEDQQLDNEEYVSPHATQLESVREALQAQQLLLLILVASSTTLWMLCAGLGVAAGIWWLPPAAVIWALTSCISYALAFYYNCPMFFGSAAVSAPIIAIHAGLLSVITFVSSTVSPLQVVTLSLSVVGVIPYAVYARFAWLRGKNLIREKILVYMTNEQPADV